MKSYRAILLTIGFLLIVAPFGCGSVTGSPTTGAEFTDSGNPNNPLPNQGNRPSEPPTGGPRGSVALIGALCAKLTGECFVDIITYDNCAAQLSANTAIDTEIGLPDGETYVDLNAVFQGETAGSLTANRDAVLQCQADIAQLSCDDPAVQQVWDRGVSDDFINLELLIPQTPGSCVDMF